MYINQIINLNNAFQTNDDQPCYGEGHQEVVKLSQPSSGEDDDMIKVKLKIFKIFFVTL